jgi:hypothetical protein
MTEDNDLLESFMDGSTRRSVLKTGTLATAGLALGTGTATAQDDDGDVVGNQEWDKAIMPVSQFHPASRFVITSPVIRWQPNVSAIQDNVWSEYNTRTIRYLNTNETSLFWQSHRAEVPEFNDQAGFVVDAEGETGPNDTPQPEVFRMRSEGSFLGDSGYVTVQFTPVGEDEQQDLLDDDWWYADDEDAIGLDDINGDGTTQDGTTTTGGN